MKARGRVPLPWPEGLADWIDGALPEIAELGGVRGARGARGARSIQLVACRRLPFDWLPGDRGAYEGITLWRRIYLRDRLCPLDAGDRGDVELLLHELIHVLQFRRSPLLFPLRYLLGLALHGYDRHPAEREAIRRAAELAAAYWRETAAG